MEMTFVEPVLGIASKSKTIKCNILQINADIGDCHLASLYSECHGIYTSKSLFYQS